jgi:phage shock protein A
MAILQRFWTVVKSNLNHFIGKAEDPEKMLNQMLLDMQEQLIQAKKQVAVSIADEKRLMQQYEQEKQLSIEWEKRAMLAVKAGNDDLAKQALERQNEHTKLAQGFDENWHAQKAAVEKLKAALQTLSEKINDAKRKKNLLIARAKRAEAQKTITETMSGISQASAFDTIGRMEEKIDRMEAEAQATTELADEIVSDELLSKFEKLEISETDDALAALKAKMGVTAPSTPAPKEAIKQPSLEEIEKEIEAEIAAKR